DVNGGAAADAQAAAIGDDELVAGSGEGHQLVVQGRAGIQRHASDGQHAGAAAGINTASVDDSSAADDTRAAENTVAAYSHVSEARSAAESIGREQGPGIHKSAAAVAVRAI